MYTPPTGNLILFYSAYLNNRVRYSAKLLFEQLLGLQLQFTADERDYLMTELPKIAYGQAPVCSPNIIIPNHSILSENNIQAQEIEVFYENNLSAFFKVNQNYADLTFDILAMIFYLVSRYEEYLPFSADHHGRFEAKQSLAYRNGFLGHAIINLWSLRFKTLLERKFPILAFNLPSYQFQPSFDIDMAWAFLHKGVLRNLGGFLKDILERDWGRCSYRIKVLRKQVADPYFCFEFIRQSHQGKVPKPIFFFLLANYGKYDKNTPRHTPQLKKLIQQIGIETEVGIHPSYRSNERREEIQKEKQQLEQILQRKVDKSRQHFLKLKFPDTYQSLIKAGVTADFSMGYAELPGFRASISTPFPWYDLSREETSELLVYPFSLMDVTLKDYLKLNTQQAKMTIDIMIKATKAARGIFIPIWHNSSLSEFEDWEGWREVYLHLLDSAR